MKTFFDGIFIDSNDPDEESEYPIKLEYYKTIETEENVKAKYGIEIVETEFKEGRVNVESKGVKNIAETSKEIGKILTMLRNYKVTPMGIEDAIDELLI